jgi:beta-glucosidase
MGQDSPDYPQRNFDSFNSTKGKVVNVQGDHAKHIREVGAASTILLKNTGDILPLTRQRLRIAVIGEDAGPGRSTDNSENCPDHGCVSGTIAQGWGSGTANFPYIVTPLEGITNRAASLNANVVSFLRNNDLDEAKGAAKNADVAVVFVSANSGEAYINVDGNQGDRKSLDLWKSGNALIEAVASVNQNVIVVIHAPGAVNMPWINNPSVKGVVLALFPGQESGNSLADVMFGDVNPSARLPFTINQHESDYAAFINTAVKESPGFSYVQVDYTEGLLVDYRYNDARNIKPLFEFGFGLSYTKFRYSNFALQGIIGAQHSPNSITVSFDVCNTGIRDGNEVAQLYLGFPPDSGEPPKQLKEFGRKFIASQKCIDFSMMVDGKEMRIWDTLSQTWRTPQGKYSVMIGASSRDIRLNGNFVI